MTEAAVDLYLTTAEAVRMVKRAPKGTRFSIHIRTDLPVADEPNRYFPKGGAHYLNLSRSDALRLAQNLLSSILEAKGARMLFQKTTYTVGDREVTTIWFC